MFKFSKKFLSLIMAILMLTMTVTGVNAEKLITGIDDLLIDIGIIDPSPEEDLMPMAARGCCKHSWVKKAYSGECIKCFQQTTVSYQECSKCGAKRDIRITCGCSA